MTMPPLCQHHASVYRTRLTSIRHLPHGHKALAREARLVARQCRDCELRHIDTSDDQENP